MASRHASPTPSRPASAAGHVSASTQTGARKYMFLYEAFFHPLPAFPEAPGWKPKDRTHYSSTSTEVKSPPACWLEVPVSHYLEKTGRELANPGVKHYLQEHPDPGMDPLFKMKAEADVVRFNNEQLALPVNHAMYASVGAGKLECYSEVPSNDSRPDKVWKRTDSSGKLAEVDSTFAIFESKIKGTILLDEFEPARVADEENVTAMIEDADENVKQTHFDGKSLKIMSQCAEYARNTSFNSNYVALFDSTYLFLGVFDQTDPFRMKGTLVPCEGPASKDARKALLGWLIEAREEKLAGRNTRSPDHPGDKGHFVTRGRKKAITIVAESTASRESSVSANSAKGSSSSGSSAAKSSHSASKGTPPKRSGSASSDSPSEAQASTGSHSAPRGSASKAPTPKGSASHGPAFHGPTSHGSVSHGSAAKGSTGSSDSAPKAGAPKAPASRVPAAPKGSASQGSASTSTLPTKKVPPQNFLCDRPRREDAQEPA